MMKQWEERERGRGRKRIDARERQKEENLEKISTGRSGSHLKGLKHEVTPHCFDCTSKEYIQAISYCIVTEIYHLFFLSKKDTNVTIMLFSLFNRSSNILRHISHFPQASQGLRLPSQIIDDSGIRCSCEARMDFRF